MTKFIDVSNDTKEVKKETVFTEYLNTNSGWNKATSTPKEFDSVKYLGNCNSDGDMFAANYRNGKIFIFKGIKGDEFN